MRKWEVYRVFRPDILPAHDKFCICVNAERQWLFYINSEPPPFRKARAVAVEVDNFEAGFLSHLSYVDVSSIIDDVPKGELEKAVADPKRCHGVLAPFLVERIKRSVTVAASLTESQKALILE